MIRVTGLFMKGVNGKLQEWTARVKHKELMVLNRRFLRWVEWAYDEVVRSHLPIFYEKARLNDEYRVIWVDSELQCCTRFSYVRRRQFLTCDVQILKRQKTVDTDSYGRYPENVPYGIRSCAIACPTTFINTGNLYQ
jgi:hypothetical protein